MTKCAIFEPGDEVRDAAGSLVGEASDVRLRMLGREALLNLCEIVGHERTNVDVDHLIECSSHLA
jgi:hypothetical protein